MIQLKKIKKIIEIKKILNQSKTWLNIERNKKIQEKKNKITKIISKIQNIENNINEIIKFIKLSIEMKDTSIISDITKEIKKIKKKIKKTNFYYIFSKKHDYLNCYLDIQSGSGGIDAQDWSKMLMRMYLKWLNKKKFKTEKISEIYGENSGIKSSTIRVIGKYAFGWLRTETGIHRLIRKSPFNSGKRRHTSFSSIFIYPEINKKTNININPSDLKIDFYKSSGSGGQHVNRTESAVRITHLPTSLVTQCQNQRSQHKNKEQAIKQMKSKLYNLEIKKRIKKQQDIENSKSSIGWGNQIRSYILDDSRIKDLRTGLEIRDTQSVLNGNLDQFIEKSLKIGL
ncbi:peptide chain release factor 2 [Buchnera aphidicola (Stegophylla sp.)]|uniref:Peptide chain release factor 2 n=1 Tax=Buchnera aphidicola (Stegophylla sp.) TaxID=2315800 RepID=A0A4D6Y9N1_9GAMM|nr:peptide chain release factor 2 [Buchnera aphidicola (Stegophylla sp.)]